jgi:Zn-dependent peptidase ImmA (M78 family)/DNA-binding XRE family transcriptional regulator
MLYLFVMTDYLSMPAVNTASLVGKRIRRAREAAGWSQAHLAEEVGKNQATVSYWEKGRRSPDLEDLVDLATALGVEVSFFFEDDRIHQPRRVLLRAQGALRALDDWATAVEEFEEQIIDADLEPLERVIRIKSDTPVRASEELLAQGRATKPPVAIDDLARSCGVHVFEAELPGQVSGLLLFVDTHVVIGFNKAHPETRRRFTIAHELGHYLLSHHDHFHIDLSDAHGNPPGYNWQDERAANDFAAAALMPSAMVTNFFEKDHSLQRLADRFNVSREAMGWRLVNLGLLS